MPRDAWCASAERRGPNGPLTFKATGPKNVGGGGLSRKMVALMEIEWHIEWHMNGILV